MLDQRLYTVSHPPHWHNGTSITAKSYHIMLAALPAVVMGIWQYGLPALRVLAFSVSWAMIWEYLLNRIMKRSVSIGDGNAAVVGLLLGMLLPATTPWYAVIVGTFVAMLIGKHMYGGIGCNPLNPLYDPANPGVAIDADSDPTVAVRKNGAAVDDSVTVTKRAATTGIYDCSWNPAAEVEGDKFTIEELSLISTVEYPNKWEIVCIAVERGTDGANTTAPLDAAGTRTALGMASADLDSQFDQLAKDIGTVDTNVDTLLTRLSAARAGYL